MIQGDLVDSYNGDMAKRDTMHNAQCLAGMAFSNALLGIVHPWPTRPVPPLRTTVPTSSTAPPTPCICPRSSPSMPRTRAKKRYGVIADEMKLGGANDDEKVKLLIEYLRGMNDALNIPHCIQHYGPDSLPRRAGLLCRRRSSWSVCRRSRKNAIADACTGSNPRQPSQEEMEKLLKCCYYDTDVDF